MGIRLTEFCITCKALPRSLPPFTAPPFFFNLKEKIRDKLLINNLVIFFFLFTLLYHLFRRWITSWMITSKSFKKEGMQTCGEVMIGHRRYQSSWTVLEKGKRFGNGKMRQIDRKVTFRCCNWVWCLFFSLVVKDVVQRIRNEAQTLLAIQYNMTAKDSNTDRKRFRRRSFNLHCLEYVTSSWGGEHFSVTAPSQSVHCSCNKLVILKDQSNVSKSCLA
jgi:hypothetical protein